jgi:hypothetical protein
LQRNPQFLVFAAGAAQLDPALKRDGHADREDEENGIHEDTTILKKSD